MQRRVYCVGLRKHVEAAIDDIVPVTGKRGTKYQCVGKYSENGKDYVVKSWVPKADYEALHGPVVEIEDIAAAEEFIGADVEAAEPLAADPVADSPVAEDSSEPLEVAPADKSYFLSESVVLSAIKEMAAEDDKVICQGCNIERDSDDDFTIDNAREYVLDDGNVLCDYCWVAHDKYVAAAEDEPDPENKTFCDTCNEYVDFAECSMGKSGYAICNECSKKETYTCISCEDEIDEADGHELVGEFQEKCCLPCVKTAFGAEQTFEAQQKKELDHVSEQAALRLIKGAYGVKRIVSGPTYYRFVEGTSSKFLMFAVVERNNGTFQAVNVYGRRGANFPTLWSSDPYPTEAQAERASKVKQKKKSRKGYVFLDAEEFRAFMAEHFNSETLNSSESIDNYMSEDVWVVELANQDGFRDAEFLGSSDDAQAYQDWVVEQDAGMTPWEITHIKDEQVLTLAKAKERFTQLYVLDDDEGGWSDGGCVHKSPGYKCVICKTEGYDAESPLDESPMDEDPLTADPSDLGGPEDFSSDASIDLEDGKITIHEKGDKSGKSKKLLLGVILVAGLAAAYQNSDAVLEFFEGLKGDEDVDSILGCMDETANNYDPEATEDDGSCTYDEDPEPPV